MNASQPPSIFVHIPKNGGTTLVRSLIYLFGHRGIAFAYSSPHSTDENNQMLAHFVDADILPHKRVAVGHFAFLPQYADRYPHFTLLREPVSRQFSWYYYIMRHPNEPLYPTLTAAGMTLERALPLLGDNQQVRYLINVFDRPLTEADVTRAKDYLEQRFTLFGLVERYDESLILFKRALGWPMPFYMVENISTNRAKHISEEARQIAIQQNTFDSLLYEWGSRLFAQRIAQQPPTFHEEMSAFQDKLNRWRHTIGPLWKRWDRFVLESRNHAIGQLARQVRNRIRGY